MPLFAALLRPRPPIRTLFATLLRPRPPIRTLFAALWRVECKKARVLPQSGPKNTQTAREPQKKSPGVSLVRRIRTFSDVIRTCRKLDRRPQLRQCCNAVPVVPAAGVFRRIERARRASFAPADFRFALPYPCSPTLTLSVVPSARGAPGLRPRESILTVFAALLRPRPPIRTLFATLL